MPSISSADLTVIHFPQFNSYTIMKKFCSVLISTLIGFFSIYAQVFTPDNVPDVNVADYRHFVSDPAGLLSPSATQTVNQMLLNLMENTTAEMAVVVVPSIGEMSPEEFTEELLRKWGIGKADRDNGLLLLIAVDNRKARFETGYGLEGILTDATLGTIIRRDIVPAMKEGNIDAAVINASAAVAKLLSTPEAIAEIKSPSGNRTPGTNMETIDPGILRNFLGLIALIAWFAGLFTIISDARSARGKDPFHKATVWRQHLILLWVLAVVSAGTGIIFPLIALWRYRTARNRPLKCSTCGEKMRKLSEEEDNELLNGSQDLEERLGTVDYDVWECPQCGTVERYAFPSRQSRYTKCPVCGTIAYGLVSDKIVMPPTVQREGIGEQTYECRYCSHTDKKRYKLARKPDPAAALAAGAILGAAARGGSGHGGGGFGGGFGGGASGGGGATGSW